MMYLLTFTESNLLVSYLPLASVVGSSQSHSQSDDEKTGRVGAFKQRMLEDGNARRLSRLVSSGAQWKVVVRSCEELTI